MLVGVLIRFAPEELAVFNAYCKTNHINKTACAKSAIRLYITNRDLVNGVIRVQDSSPDNASLEGKMDAIFQKVSTIEEKIKSTTLERDSTRQVFMDRILEAILLIRKDAETETTTVDKLRVLLERINPSFSPYLYASDSCFICVLDEVLKILEGQGKLRLKYPGIVRWLGGE
ncbi:MAG: hypothetical protein ABSB71_08950 [Candidatus Bathyarchaeia archaeon]|jgi:hypothetical protein